MSTQDLTHQEAIKKMKDMAESVKIAMLLTGLNHPPISVNPMTTKRVDDDGSIWFLSALNSDHNKNIQSECRVQLIYSHPGEMLFLSISGEAFVRSHQNTLKSLYHKDDDKWFTGIEDPNLTAIQVIPDKAYYWNKKHNQFVSFFERGMEKLTGDKIDNEEKGKLNL